MLLVFVMRLFIFVILFPFKGYVFCNDTGKVNYRGYQVWSADIRDRNVSSKFIDAVFEKDVWHADDQSIHFLLGGNETDHWKKFLRAHNINYTVLLEDVQNAIQKEEALKIHGSRRVSWDSYANLNEIYRFIKEKADANPKICSLRTIGKTVHKKDIKMLKITDGKVGNSAILLEAGLHGREWLGVACLLYFIDSLTANFTTLPPSLRHKDWYIIPVANPDGYEYSMSKDRLWRKNRRRFSGPCDGVDVNRNFEKFWSMKASTVMCSNDFCGPAAFSEPESMAIRDLVKEVHFTAYVSIHWDGNNVHYPWIATGRFTVDAHSQMSISTEIKKAMEQVNKERLSSKTEVFRRAGGMSVDWAYQQGIVHSYMIETRSLSFQVNQHDILHSATEISAGIKRLAELIVS